MKTSPTTVKSHDSLLFFHNENEALINKAEIVKIKKVSHEFLHTVCYAIQIDHIWVKLEEVCVVK